MLLPLFEPFRKDYAQAYLRVTESKDLAVDLYKTIPKSKHTDDVRTMPLAEYYLCNLLGRQLESGETVGFIDGNPNNMDIENLKVVQGNSTALDGPEVVDPLENILVMPVHKRTKDAPVYQSAYGSNSGRG